MRYLTLIALLALLAPSAQAQDITSITDRMARLERDITFLQRQVYRGGAAADPNAPVPAAEPGSSNAQTLVQFNQLQEEMRQLRGQFEQVQYNNARLGNELKKLSEDVDYRLQSLEQKVTAIEENKTDGDDEVLEEEDAPMEEEALEEEALKETPADQPASYQPDNGTTVKKQFENASAHYSYAFKLMNDRKFEQASQSFEDFVGKYPKDPLTANAYYWLGESYYVRSEYTKAAAGFRKGFEAAPKGQKAPDNLLKLAMSLSALKRKDQACVVLKQLISKYGNRAPDARTKAQREYGKLQCT